MEGPAFGTCRLTGGKKDEGSEDFHWVPESMCIHGLGETRQKQAGACTLTRNWTGNLLQADTQSTEPHQRGQNLHFLRR